MQEESSIFGTTPEGQLDTVNKAIYAILKGGQSYQIGSRRLTRADLELLLEMQSRLQAQIVSGQDSMLFADTVVAVFDGR